MRPIPTLLVSATIAATSSAALAQAITIDIETPVLRPGESTTVTLIASFSTPDYAMAGIATSISSLGSGWSDLSLLAPLDGPGTNPGARSGTGVDGIIAGQVHFPGGAAIFADPTNPVAFWQATYTASMVTDPTSIDLRTETTKFDVYIAEESTRSESRLADLTEGSATIRVIPAPASSLVLALGAFIARRRR